MAWLNTERKSHMGDSSGDQQEQISHHEIVKKKKKTWFMLLDLRLDRPEPHTMVPA